MGTVLLWPEMLRRPGHLLVRSLLPARWMTLLLDCDTITTNQLLERDQTANQLLELIGSHYRAQPITYLAQLCRLYCCLVYFSHFLSVCLADGLFLISYSHHCPLLILYIFISLEKDKIPEKKERDRREDTRTSAPLAFGWPARIPAHTHNRSLKTPQDYYSSLFLCTDVTGKEQSPSTLNISVLHTNRQMYTYTHIL